LRQKVSALHVLAVQFTFSLVAFGLLGRWHLGPRLAATSREAALVPLLWIHVFRYAPLALYATGQVDPRVPSDVAVAIGYGDLVSAVLALLAVCALELRAPAAIPLAWVFTVVGSGDLVWATYKAVGAQLYKLYIGWNWYILNFYVPMLIVSQVMIIGVLSRRSSNPNGRG
jgi:fucose 4-O-acetylase-like acetyltransferase